MTRTLVLSLFSIACVVVIGAIGAPRAYADGKSDRALIAEASDTLAATAGQLAETAAASKDRAVRKKLAPRADELGDGLTALARKARRDAAYDALAKAASELARDAGDLVDLADEAEDKDERKALRASAQYLETNLVALRQAIEAVAARGDGDGRPAPMTAQAFARLLASVKGADFDSDRTAVVQHAAQANWFTSNQVADVIALFDFDDGRVDAAAAMWPHIVDPENSFVIFDKFDFDGGRDKLRKRVGQ